MTSSSMQVQVLNHSLASHHLAALRHRDTPSDRFRYHAGVLATLLAAEATRELSVRPITVPTPLEETQCRVLSGRIAAVPILRAGLGMVTPLMEMIPDLEVWHLGLYRDEATATPVHYYDKLPASDPPDRCFVLDPMLATGGSACMAFAALKKWGVKNLSMLSLIAAPEGIRRLTTEHPDVRLITAAIDRQLDERSYILPGLGDAGDRIFHTGARH